MPFDTTQDGAVGAVRGWFAEHGEAAVTVADLIGGRREAAAVLDLIAEVRTANALTRRLRLRLVGLHRLLTLDADDPPAALPIEAGDPRVFDICCLADSLRDLLEEIATDQPVAA